MPRDSAFNSEEDGVTIPGKTMDSDQNVIEHGRSWKSIHVCPNCGLAIDLAELEHDGSDDRNSDLPTL
jgi:hypothetical protein